MTIRTEFKESSHFGLPWEELQKAGYESAVCAVLWDAKLPMKVGELVHLWRLKEGGEGLELRSRYWLGHQVHLDLGLVKIPLDRAGGITRIKKRLAGEKVVYEQFLHDQIEFTILVSILPDLYHEFGCKAKAKFLNCGLARSFYTVQRACVARKCSRKEILWDEAGTELVSWTSSRTGTWCESLFPDLSAANPVRHIDQLMGRDVNCDGVVTQER